VHIICTLREKSFKAGGLMKKGIALALSGGGYRAMAFHAGVCRYLAEAHGLDSVKFISTVSGGSLFAGYVISQAGMKWPSSDDYLKTSYPAVRDLLTSYDLQLAALARLAFRITNWPHIFSRANIIAQALKEDLKIDCTLYDLPISPEWSINGTTAETGKRIRFKFDEVGEYSLGYAQARNFPLASAMAASAAFPVGIGPYSLPTRKYQWVKRPWKAPMSEAKVVKLPYRRLRIYDGGVYDNLGLEPIFDNGILKTKVDASIVASDAGAPLKEGFNLGTLNPFRVKRILDIATDQNRSLRVRSLHGHLDIAKTGACIWIGDKPNPGNDASTKHTTSYGRDCLTSLERQHVRSYPTNLSQMRPEDFDLIAQHGYEAAQWAHRLRPFA
tara:strand:+ start:15028 stop:16185 length:1158 start_codon:yes stop_codon:yes gene_type:complete